MNPAEEYILRQKEPFQSILLCIRTMVLANENIQEQFKYGLPFYRFKEKPFCYFNVPKRKNRVDMCFWHGFTIEDKHHLLHASDRKMIKCMEIRNLEESFKLMRKK